MLTERLVETTDPRQGRGIRVTDAIVLGPAPSQLGRQLDGLGGSMQQHEQRRAARPEVSLVRGE